MDTDFDISRNIIPYGLGIECYPSDDYSVQRVPPRYYKRFCPSLGNPYSNQHCWHWCGRSRSPFHPTR